MTEIEPRPELDWAVAKAIGLKTAATMRYHESSLDDIPSCVRVLLSPREWDEMRGIDHPTCEGDVACVPFRPSTDLNAAFAAAEKAAASKQGFGEWDMSTYIGRDERGWSCQIGDTTERSFEATPALAICAAILKLKEKP